MQIGSQNASQIQNIEGNIDNFTVNASFSGDIKSIKSEISKEVGEIKRDVPEVAAVADELEKELESEVTQKDSLFEKFEKFGSLVKKVADSEETVKKLVSLGAKVGSLLTILL